MVFPYLINSSFIDKKILLFLLFYFNKYVYEILKKKYN